MNLVTRVAAQRTVDLGKDGSEWKHGYIPENPVAVAMKNHKHGKGGGVKTPVGPGDTHKAETAVQAKERIKGAMAKYNSGGDAKARNDALAEKGIRDNIKAAHPVGATRDYKGRDVMVLGHSGRKVKVSDRANSTTKLVSPDTLDEVSAKTNYSGKIAAKAVAAKTQKKPLTVSLPINQLEQYTATEMRNWQTKGSPSMKARATAELARRKTAKAK